MLGKFPLLHLLLLRRCQSVPGEVWTLKRKYCSSTTTGSDFEQGRWVEDEKGRPSREYFYTVDHNGMVYLSDVRIKNFTSCFKDVSFLRLFYSNLTVNSTTRHTPTYPWLSRCGLELNYVCAPYATTPIVFTRLSPNNNTLYYGAFTEDNEYTGSTIFDKDKVTVDEEGRVFHPVNIRRQSSKRQQLLTPPTSHGLIASRLSDKLIQEGVIKL